MSEENGTRINKFIADSGLASRRKADELIANGLITINDRIAVNGDRVFPDDKVCYGKKVLTREEKNILLLFNKPKGIVCTAAEEEENNIVKYINYPERIYPIGRLDKDSHGLILMTNRGNFFNDIVKARYRHEKEYVVKLTRPYDDKFLRQMSRGVYLEELGKKTRPCMVKPVSEKSFNIILTEGLNREIRRMCEALGYRVADLCRIRIMNLRLDGIKEGEYRDITESEKNELEKQIGKKLW